MSMLIVVAAAVVQDGRLLVVSKQAAPHIFYLPGGKPEPGEAPLDTLCREFREELGVTPHNPRLLATVENRAALEDQQMRMTVYTADLTEVPQPAAELAELRWIADEDDAQLAPAVREQVLPLIRDALASWLSGELESKRPRELATEWAERVTGPSPTAEPESGNSGVGRKRWNPSG